MNAREALRRFFALGAGSLLVFIAACAMMTPVRSLSLTLTGSEEVPPVASQATGKGNFTVASNQSVSGNVLTSGLSAVAAHLHSGARGENGPIVIGLVKTADNIWAVPAGAQFNDAQYAAYKAGRMYVNVHTPANRGGEIRAQLTP